MLGITRVLLYVAVSCCQMTVFGHLYTSSISYMEPVHYDRQSLHHQHRTRRSTKEFIQLKFDAFSREWSIKLKNDRRIFHDNVLIENSRGPIKYDVQSAYTGYVDGEQSHVRNYYIIWTF